MDWVFWLFIVPIGLFFWTAFLGLFFVVVDSAIDFLRGDQ